jgi:hypothetical protein
MPNIREVFRSRFLKAHDLGGATPVVTIDRVVVEVVGGQRKEKKLVMYFVNKERGMILNRTLAEAIASIVGSERTEDWPGHRIRLFATKVKFGNEMVDAIRVRAVTASTPATSARPSSLSATGPGETTARRPALEPNPLLEPEWPEEPPPPDVDDRDAQTPDRPPAGDRGARGPAAVEDIRRGPVHQRQIRW